MVETAIWGGGAVEVEVEVEVSEWGSAVLGNREKRGLGGIGAVFGGGGVEERENLLMVWGGRGDVISNRPERSKGKGREGKGRGGRPVG